MRVLLVEDNVRHATAIVADLKAEGIRVEVAGDPQDAFHFVQDFKFDLVLIKLALLDMDGNALIRRVRMAKLDTPIIALSGVPQARLKALAAGADDVVDRDIDQAELAARIRAIVRRSCGFSQPQLRVGNLVLDVDQQEVTAAGVRVSFTPKEFAILELLALRRNVVLTKEAILSHLYGGMDEPEIKIIDVFVCKIRSKLAKAGLPNLVSTVWGRGYSIKSDKHDELPASPVLPQPARSREAFA